LPGTLLPGTLLKEKGDKSSLQEDLSSSLSGFSFIGWINLQCPLAWGHELLVRMRMDDFLIDKSHQREETVAIGVLKC